MKAVHLQGAEADAHGTGRGAGAQETLTLEVALQKGPEPYMLALLMPEYWKPFIRNGPIEQVGSIAANRLLASS